MPFRFNRVILLKNVLPMQELKRFGVSIEATLLRRFDRLIRASGYHNRSEAFRDLIRARLVEEEIKQPTTIAFGVLSLLYDHHTRELEEKLTELQHEHHASVIATTHVHVDHAHCLEVILLKGRVEILQSLAGALASLKGVQHSRLVLTTTEPHP